MLPLRHSFSSCLPFHVVFPPSVYLCFSYLKPSVRNNDRFIPTFVAYPMTYAIGTNLTSSFADVTLPISSNTNLLAHQHWKFFHHTGSLTHSSSWSLFNLHRWPFCSLRHGMLTPTWPTPLPGPHSYLHQLFPTRRCRLLLKNNTVYLITILTKFNSLRLYYSSNPKLESRHMVSFFLTPHISGHRSWHPGAKLILHSASRRYPLIFGVQSTSYASRHSSVFALRCNFRHWHLDITLSISFSLFCTSTVRQRPIPTLVVLSVSSCRGRVLAQPSQQSQWGFADALFTSTISPCPMSETAAGGCTLT